jgi:WD40 repeat protein
MMLRLRSFGSFLGVVVVLGFPGVLLSQEKPAEPVRLGEPGEKYTGGPFRHKQALVFSADGKRLAWVHGEGFKEKYQRGKLVIHYWDVDKRRELHEMRPDLKAVWASGPPVFSHDGKFVFLPTYELVTEFTNLGRPGTYLNHQVRAWNLKSGDEVDLLAGYEKSHSLLDAVWADGEGKRVVAANAGEMVIYELPKRKPAARRAWKEPMSGIVFSRDGKTAAGFKVKNMDVKERIVVIQDTTGEAKPRLWEDAFMPLGFMPGRSVFSPDGKLMAWNEGGKIHVAETGDGRLLYRLDGEPGPVVFSPDGRRLAQACPNGTALVWTLPKK